MYNNTNSDINECTSRGVCSLPPNISALQELLMFFIKQTAFYIVELKKLGVNNYEIKEKIISDLASIISISEFSEKQLYQIVYDNFCMLKNTKAKYISTCNNRNIDIINLDFPIDYDEKSSLSKTIAQGERVFLINYKKFSQNQRNLFEILNVVIKSVCLNIKKLEDYESNQLDNIFKVIKCLSIYNKNIVQEKNIEQEIEQLSALNSNLQLELCDKLLSAFGNITKVSVSHSTTKGKAILVSGSDFFDLLNVLEATKNSEIDIYTHSGLLICHALKKFRQYKNLKGHYGKSTESCILDFATFPGPILLTKNSKKGAEYLYRGKLYSNDYVTPQGVIKIENNDYSELVSSAYELKGFKKGKIKTNSEVGYDEDEVEQKLENILSKLKTGDIKRLYIIGINSYSEVQKEYFNEFFDNLRSNEYVISFSYSSKLKNVLTFNIGDYTPLATKILAKIFNSNGVTDKINFFFTTCDVMTITGIIRIKLLGAGAIYMAPCPPTLLNPSVLDSFLNKYNIRITKNACEDLKFIRANKNTPQ